MMKVVEMSKPSIIRLHQIFFEFTQIRKVISISYRVSEFDAETLEEMESSCKQLFKACCNFENNISPSLWTLCNVAPYHAKITMREYGLGLGINTIEGSEQKHNASKKYSHNTTFQNWWPMIFCHFG